ncbi:TPA: hypothetical protein ACRZ6V_004636 [Vibrio harveyi]
MQIMGKTLDQWLFTNKEQIAFLQQWIKADKYKLSTHDFCRALIENGDSTLKAIGQAGLEAPGQGKSFSDVLEGWLPPVVLATIKASEKAGKRYYGIMTAVDQLQGGENIIAQIVRIMAFPYILTVGFGFYGVYIADKMLITIDYAPGLGLTVRNIMTTYGPWVSVLVLFLMVIMAIALPNWSGSTRETTDSLPLFSLYRTAVAATILKTLANLNSCGMKLDDALEEIEQHNTPFVKYHIKKMRQQAIGQTNLGLILDTGLLLPYELSAMKILGSTVDYSLLLKEGAQSHSENTKQRIARLKAVLPKAGIFAAILVLGSLIVSSTYQLYTSFM